MWVAQWSIWSQSKCTASAPPLPCCATPPVRKGRKSGIDLAKFRTFHGRNVKISGLLTQLSPPFTTVQADFKSDKPTPLQTHPYPLEGVSSEVGRDGSETMRLTLLNTAHVFFFDSDHPWPSYPLGGPTPF